MVYLGCLAFYFQTSAAYLYKVFKDIIIVFVTSTIAFIYVVSNGIQGCISVDMLSLYLLIALVGSVSLVRGIHMVYALISILGRYSLEIYLGNMTTLIVIPYFDYSPSCKTMTYFVLTTLLSFIYVRLNKAINMLIINKT